jgi:hypothetical protein
MSSEGKEVVSKINSRNFQISQSPLDPRFKVCCNTAFGRHFLWKSAFDALVDAIKKKWININYCMCAGTQLVDYLVENISKKHEIFGDYIKKLTLKFKKSRLDPHDEGDKEITNHYMKHVVIWACLQCEEERRGNQQNE